MTSDTRVVRWQRYGKDRLYVTGADDRRLGWCDLGTGVITVEDDGDREAVVAAVDTWRADGAHALAPALAPAPVEPPTPPTRSVAPDTERAPVVEDLALRRAGQAAREQATALRRAAPVRTFLARLLGVHTDERAWRIGADGEDKVAAQLARLVREDPRWHVLHAVPVGDRGSDIDHVAIGPAGVFTLNAKHHPRARIWVAGRTFLVNGAKQPYLRNSRHEAERAGRLLTAAAGFPVAATGVVVAVGARDVVVRSAPEGAHVTTRRALRRWLSHRPTVLADDAIEQVFQVARQSSTWQPV